jgi:adenosylcobyric acid synthase
VSRHGGNLHRIAADSGQKAADILDFSANLNPLGPPEWLHSVVSARVADVARYPDPDSTELVQAIADSFCTAPDQIAVGNGSAELLVFLPLVLNARRALIPVPAYVDYRAAAEAAALPVKTIPLAREHGFRLDFEHLEAHIEEGDLVFLARPNNPTGLSWDANVLREMAERWPATTFVVDEAFADFVAGFDSLAFGRPENVVVLRSFTKFYCIPGLRLGCIIADPQMVRRVRARLPPWSVNVLAQVVGAAVLRDASGYAERTKALVALERSWLLDEFSTFKDLVAIPGEANFLLLRLERRDLDATELARRMLRIGVAIRTCANFDGLDPRYLRVAVRTREQNEALCRALRTALGHGSDPYPRAGVA